MVDCNKRTAMRIEERLFLETLGEDEMFLYLNLEARDEFAWNLN